MPFPPFALDSGPPEGPLARRTPGLSGGQPEKSRGSRVSIGGTGDGSRHPGDREGLIRFANPSGVGFAFYRIARERSRGFEAAPPCQIAAVAENGICSRSSLSHSNPLATLNRRLDPPVNATTPVPRAGLGSWRNGRDSNPRYGYPYVPLARECFRPLSHRSVLQGREG